MEIFVDILLDFWNTFDTVDQTILLTKLFHQIHMVLKESYRCGLKLIVQGDNILSVTVSWWFVFS